MKQSLLIIILVLSTSIAHGQDYEAQLNHQLPRLADGLSDIAKKNKLFAINFVCISYNKEHVKSLVNNYSGKSTFEKIQNNKYKVKLRHELMSTKLNPKQWIRTQFFYGIAYHCNMDGLEKL